MSDRGWPAWPITSNQGSSQTAPAPVRDWFPGNRGSGATKLRTSESQATIASQWSVNQEQTGDAITSHRWTSPWWNGEPDDLPPISVSKILVHTPV